MKRVQGPVSYDNSLVFRTHLDDNEGKNKTNQNTHSSFKVIRACMKSLYFRSSWLDASVN